MTTVVFKALIRIEKVKNYSLALSKIRIMIVLTIYYFLLLRKVTYNKYNFFYFQMSCSDESIRWRSSCGRGRARVPTETRVKSHGSPPPCSKPQPNWWPPPCLPVSRWSRQRSALASSNPVSPLVSGGENHYLI